jgi:hypothetical protein
LSETERQPKETLVEFINKYHNVFTVLGVMGGLAALFTRLQNAEYLSILSFAIMLILDIQLWFKFPRNEKGTFSITIFEMFFQVFMAAIGYYLFSAYWIFIEPYLIFLVSFSLFGVFCGILIVIVRKCKFNIIIREITGEGKIKSSILRTVIASSIIGGLFIAALFISKYLLTLLGFS